MKHYRQDFPILKQNIHGKPLVYLDSAASSQKPQQVIDAVSHYYSHDHANIHRGVHSLSQRATDAYEKTREAVRGMINANSLEEIIFVRGATEGINLVAQSYGRTFLKAGDEILLTEMEHHSNIVPWQLLAEQIGVVIKVLPIKDNGELDLELLSQLLSTKTKLLAITHVSNALGTLNPVHEIIKQAHERQIPVLVDGAQAFGHLPIDVKALDCDFYVFSSHKAYGPTGVGVLYAKKALLERMPPYQGGGDMIETVSFQGSTYNQLPNKFEAGTPNIAGVIGFGAAIAYIQNVGLHAIYVHEQELLKAALEKLRQVPGLRIIGEAKDRIGVISFVMEDCHPHDLGTILDHQGVAVRAGHHCAMPLMDRLGLPATARLSLGLYNNHEDIDALVEGLLVAKRIFA